MADTIKVTCTAAVNLDINDLVPLQGDLKELSKASFEKLKRSILRYGLSFPLHVWEHEGKNFVIDGHQRDKVIRKMAQEGFVIPALPCVIVEARDKTEAAAKILLASSQYGRMSEESLDEFLSQNDLSFLDLSDEIDLPAIDESYFADPNDFGAATEDEQGRLDQKSPVTCPHCGEKFVP